MSDLKADKNKAIVLEAFDTLFNKRDYMAAEQFWSAKYIQHSGHIEPGRRRALQPHQGRAAVAQV
jgi:predicted SnoaL-like aldol condensation-catalyzing enzyme